MFNIASIIKKNKAELLKGTSVEPLSHPSYSKEKQEELKENRTKYEASIARAKKRYNID